MYSIFIVVLFYAFSFWLIKKEWGKDPSAKSIWRILSAILSLVAGAAVTLVWLIAIWL